MLKHFRRVLTSPSFNFNGQCYKLSDCAAMGSSLSPVSASFFVKNFEETALVAVNSKFVFWFRYMDDMSILLPHGPGKLSEFLDHLNITHGNT
jgi:hypothetical protein